MGKDEFVEAASNVMDLIKEYQQYAAASAMSEVDDDEAMEEMEESPVKGSFEKSGFDSSLKSTATTMASMNGSL